MCRPAATEAREGCKHKRPSGSIRRTWGQILPTNASATPDEEYQGPSVSRGVFRSVARTKRLVQRTLGVRTVLFGDFIVRWTPWGKEGSSLGLLIPCNSGDGRSGCYAHIKALAAHPAGCALLHIVRCSSGDAHLAVRLSPGARVCACGCLSSPHIMLTVLWQVHLGIRAQAGPRG